MKPITLCCYVSGHGLGHASRACQVMQCLPDNVRLIVKSRAPEAFFRRESKRPLEYHAEQFDIGAVQASNVQIDWAATREEALKLEAQRPALVAREAAFLTGEGVDAVVCDVAPMPLEAAVRVQVPGIVVANFTWVEIYRNAARENRDLQKVIATYRQQYASASLLLRTPLSFPMPYLPNAQDIPLIARAGSSRRQEIDRKLGLAPGTPLVLLYLGGWGSDEMDFQQLVQMSAGANQVAFVALTRMPDPVHYLDPDQWHFPDVVASADAVMAKPGYGTIGECMANGTPIVYYPRREFAEYPHLRRGMAQWGGAVQISRPDFLACRWRQALSQALALRPVRVRADGAQAAVDAILGLAQEL